MADELKTRSEEISDALKANAEAASQETVDEVSVAVASLAEEQASTEAVDEAPSETLGQVIIDEDGSEKIRVDWSTLSEAFSWMSTDEGFTYWFDRAQASERAGDQPYYLTGDDVAKFVKYKAAHEADTTAPIGTASSAPVLSSGEDNGPEATTTGSAAEALEDDGDSSGNSGSDKADRSTPDIDFTKAQPCSEDFDAGIGHSACVHMINKLEDNGLDHTQLDLEEIDVPEHVQEFVQSIPMPPNIHTDAVPDKIRIFVSDRLAENETIICYVCLSGSHGFMTHLIPGGISAQANLSWGNMAADPTHEKWDKLIESDVIPDIVKNLEEVNEGGFGIGFDNASLEALVPSHPGSKMNLLLRSVLESFEDFDEVAQSSPDDEVPAEVVEGVGEKVALLMSAYVDQRIGGKAKSLSEADLTVLQLFDAINAGTLRSLHFTTHGGRNFGWG